MEATLHDLGQLLLKAVPTVILLLVVHFYLKSMFFRPMGDVLAKRRAATEGLKETAEAMRAGAVQKTAAIEEQLRQAREAIYQEQEEARRRWTTEQAAKLDEARGQARGLMQQGKERLDVESAAAKKQLAASADGLAGEIVQAVLGRSAA